jgi:hypothetical protein
VTQRRRVALATCAEYATLDEDDQLLLAPLDARGIDAVPLVWDVPADWAAFDAVIIRQTWDCAERGPEFLAWIDRVAADTPVLNPRAVIAWSMDKRYLRDLAADGVPCVPTTFLEPGDPWSLPASGEYVVKPTDSAGSRNTARYSPGDTERADAHIRRLHAEGRTVMLQPYLASVDEQGESALLFFDGVFSHTARKGPLLSREAAVIELLFIKESISPRRVRPEELAVAEAALAAARARTGVWPPLYARVDLVDDPAGAPMVLELEMVEPSVFLATDPKAADRFAAAIDARVTPRVRGT